MMKYERMTKRTETGGVKYAKNGIYAEDICERLAELEDKIEQGTLIELPCKAGGTIFEIIPKCTGGGLQCPYNGGFGTSRCENGCGAYINETKFTFLSMRELIGKSLFLTREEAEKRLKELQE